MFTLMLNGHPDLVVPRETWFLSDLMDELPLTGVLADAEVERAVSIVLDHWRWAEWRIDDGDLGRAAGALESPELADLIHAIYALPLAEGGGRRWGDKTPGYTAEIGRLHRVFPDAQFIHLIRDGRDVSLSLQKTGWQGETTRAVARYWADTVESACTVGRALGPERYMEVSYETLVLDTETVLSSVCEFLGVDFQPAMLDFNERAAEYAPERTRSHLGKTFRSPRPSDVSRWPREMSRLDLAVVEAYAGSTLELTGYDRAIRHGLGVVRAVCDGLDTIAERTLPARRKLGLHFPRLRKSL